MKCKMYAVFVASLGVALIVAANDTFGASVEAHSGRSALTHSTFHHSNNRARMHYRRDHRRHAVQTISLGAGGYFYGSANGEPEVTVTEPTSGYVNYTCTLDIPWDYVHRCPSPPDPPPTPYFSAPDVPGCPTQRVTVLAADGTENTVSIVRCY